MNPLTLSILLNFISFELAAGSPLIRNPRQNAQVSNDISIPQNTDWSSKPTSNSNIPSDGKRQDDLVIKLSRNVLSSSYKSPPSWMNPYRGEFRNQPQNFRNPYFTPWDRNDNNNYMKPTWSSQDNSELNREFYPVLIRALLQQKIQLTNMLRDQESSSRYREGYPPNFNYPPYFPYPPPSYNSYPSYNPFSSPDYPFLRGRPSPYERPPPPWW